MQQRTVEVPKPHFAEETVAVVVLPREGVQHRTAEQIEDIPQFREETVGAVMLVPRDRGQQWSAEREARLREQFQQLWDQPHNRKWLVKEVREFVAGLGSERAC